MIEHRENNHLYRVIPIFNNREKIVASVNLSVGHWAAYIGKGSWRNVADYGRKISESKAQDWFPELAAEYEWRD